MLHVSSRHVITMLIAVMMLLSITFTTAEVANASTIPTTSNPTIDNTRGGVRTMQNVSFEEFGICPSAPTSYHVIRQEEMGKRASEVAVHMGVRQALVARQQAFRQEPGLVADGRDMASVIFTDAVTKVFLTASAEARADRRYKQLIAKGFSANIQVLLQDLRERDARDANRSNSPLKAVEGAHHLDTTSMTIEEAVNQVLKWHQAS